MSKATLLLVDDDRLILATLSPGLRAAGYKVVTAESGEQALKALQQEHIDLAVLDVCMPGMSGIDVAKHLREETDIPFVFLSAYGDDDVVSQGVAEGALVYLVKPLDVSQLVPAIDAALSRSHDLAELRQSQDQLTTALAANRNTSVAVGLLMERYRLSEREAFERLRSFARSHRRKLHDVAEEVVKSVEALIFPPDKTNTR